MGISRQGDSFEYANIIILWRNKKKYQLQFLVLLKKTAKNKKKKKKKNTYNLELLDLSIKLGS